jgi:hypothetical protein
MEFEKYLSVAAYHTLALTTIFIIIPFALMIILCISF